MLELKNITKDYISGQETVQALKGISLSFRKNEFVSILGPSGCGKTTMLNIIGGLDHYTQGDLIINGKSTKEYKDRDWDAYRNHSIGFVFQSYNLIPHQTVLSNVELALTLSGVSKKERRERAIEALKKVGLGNQLKKRPAEMSGGQMQRVAIARAIVNDPDIILADEPTGALDTETSIQVMDILKEIAQDRLVIMVTHNPDLAKTYSTRIVRMLDGVILEDSSPLSEDEKNTEREEDRKRIFEKNKQKNPSMSFFTSFGLSLRNLFTKKGRTALTSIAGSIGIIGIALIYAVSNGTTVFINSVQEETLASYPITIQAQTVDMSSLLQTFMGKAESISEHENDGIYEKASMYELLNALSNMDVQYNDLKAFKIFLDSQRAKEDSRLSSNLSAVAYQYDANLMIYTKNIDGQIIKSDVTSMMMDLLKNYAGLDYSTLMSMSGTSYGTMTTSSLWKELLEGDNGQVINSLVTDQYDLIYGTWPNSYNEVILFVDEKQEIDDMTLYALGLKSDTEIQTLMEKAYAKEEIDYEVKKWSYEEICSMDFRTILASSCYSLDESTGLYEDLRNSEAGLKYLYDNAMSLKVVGIAKADESAVNSSSKSSIGYTTLLTKYIIEKAHESASVKAQLENPNTDIFTGLPFKSTDGSMTNEEKATYFRNYVSNLSLEKKAEMFVAIKSIPSEEMLTTYLNSMMQSLTREDIEKMIMQNMTSQTGMSLETIKSYIASMSDDQLFSFVKEAMIENYKEQYAVGIRSQLASYTVEQKADYLDYSVALMDDEEASEMYDEVLEFSDSTYEKNLINMGCVELDSPSSINLYASSFEGKDEIEAVIAEYNASVDEIYEITYTDYVGIIMSSVTTIIDAISYVLIGFVSVSLVVSSIMIGVITLISVQERTKEIGILRAIGASKRNVSSMFNAETVIIGFTSGIFGVLVTYLLCIPINLILMSLTDLKNLKAVLPPTVAVLLVVISILLTLIAGIIPSRSASKKDPVVALRTE